MARRNRCPLNGVWRRRRWRKIRREEADAAAEGAFVVVVVADKKSGGNRRGWRRHDQNFTQNLTPVRPAHVPLSQGEGQRQGYPTRRLLLPIGEGEMAGLAALAAVALAL